MLTRSRRSRALLLAVAMLLAGQAGPASRAAAQDDSDAPRAAQDSRDDRAAPTRRDDRGDAGRRDDRGDPARRGHGGLGDQFKGLGLGILGNHAAEIAGDAFQTSNGQRALTPLAPIARHRPGSGAPPPGEVRLVPDEVVVEAAANSTALAIAALAQRNGLTILEQLASQLSGTRLLRARIADGRDMAAVLGALEIDPAVFSAQPNYLYGLQAQTPSPQPAADAPLQYALEKMHLQQAHALSTGNHVLVAMIDSGVDASQTELKGAIAKSFDALGGPAQAHSHGTAVAGLIAAHGRLTGSAPAARLLVVRAFAAEGAGAQGSSFNILKGLDWAAVQGARVVNMSFAGPPDPAVQRAMDSAYRNAIVLVAAAGNAGPKSPPLYPGADPHVIAVTATDAGDDIFPDANRGDYIAVAAPGVDLLVAAPGNGYEISSGTSLSAAEVSGIVALILQRRPSLDPDAVRAVLVTTAHPLPAGQRPGSANPRLVDAFQALSAPTSGAAP